MVPLRDRNPISIVPYVTYALIIANILVFLQELSWARGGELERFFHLYAVVPKELTLAFNGQSLGQPVPEWLTLFSSQFLHGGWLHLGGNMLYLWIFGNNIEEKLGRGKFLFFYLACGALAGLIQWFFSSQSTTPSLGASGAIAGVMGAYILRFPRAEILTLIPLLPPFLIFPVRVPALFFLGFWFVQQALYGYASLDSPTNIGMEGGGVAYWAHAGGFVVGAVLAPLIGLFNDEEGGDRDRRYN